ncbi:DUF1176 domain-containing protein [Brevundimonas sp.]|uniref:DUF1176 domain-containing protein n=1 Tax=Brevundimonas sp. TaxID=1871086 RepID=UPI002D4391D2|nr:DUF1176 domain-containing protein [Brevundimonas sp.]HYD27932.1 DUF1176 domain-containing protein [Brevundimonas sp.]
MNHWKSALAWAGSLVILSACGPADASGETAASIPSTASGGTQTTAAAPGMASETRTFRDWMAICDNGNACFAFGPGREGLGWIRVAIQPGPDAQPEVAAGYWPGEAEGTGAFALTIDGVGYPMSLATDDPVAAEVPAARALEVARALANGSAARIGADHELSLSGAAAALLWIDERQGRVNTVTALRRPGRRAAASVRAAPPLPVVTPAPAVSQTGFGDQNQVLPAALEAVPAVAACRAETSEHWIGKEVMSARLNATTELWAVPCFAGAYNMGHDWYVTGPGGRDPRPARLASTSDDPGAGTINGGYSPETRTIVAFAKGRGVGDCGTASTWTWTGREFVLTHESEMRECWGVPSDYWPTTWRTR